MKIAYYNLQRSEGVSQDFGEIYWRHLKMFNLCRIHYPGSQICNLNHYQDTLEHCSNTDTTHNHISAPWNSPRLMYIWEKNNNKSQVWLLRGQLGCRLYRTWFTGSCTFTMFYQVIENRKRKLSFSPDNHQDGGPPSPDNWPLGAPGQAVTCPDQSFLTNVRNRFGVKLLTLRSGVVVARPWLPLTGLGGQRKGQCTVGRDPAWPGTAVHSGNAPGLESAESVHDGITPPPRSLAGHNWSGPTVSICVSRLEFISIMTQ